MGFAEKLKEARSKKGVSQEELAEMVGVSRQSVSKWESKECYPKLETLMEVVSALEISMDWLLEEELMRED